MTISRPRMELFNALSNGELTDSELLLLDVALQTDDGLAGDYLRYIEEDAQLDRDGVPGLLYFENLLTRAWEAACREVWDLPARNT